MDRRGLMGVSRHGFMIRRPSDNAPRRDFDTFQPARLNDSAAHGAPVPLQYVATGFQKSGYESASFIPRTRARSVGGILIPKNSNG